MSTLLASALLTVTHALCDLPEVACSLADVPAHLQVFVNAPITLSQPFRLHNLPYPAKIAGSERAALRGSGRLIDIVSATVTITNLVIAGDGRGDEAYAEPEDGCANSGLVRVRDGQLTLASSVIEGGAAPGNGGGICAENSELRVEGSAIRSNRARYHGGGIAAYRSSVILSNVVISANAGGGIAAFAGEIDADGFLVTANKYYGIYIAESIRPHQLVSGTIAANGLAGLVAREAGAYLRHVLVKQNGAYGVKVGHQASAQLNHVTIRNHRVGLYVDDFSASVNLFGVWLRENEMNCLGEAIYPTFSVSDDRSCVGLFPLRFRAYGDAPSCKSWLASAIPAPLCLSTADAQYGGRCAIGALACQ